jgi:hypothetical protein
MPIYDSAHPLPRIAIKLEHIRWSKAAASLRGILLIFAN